jgi:UDP-N-acetylmuramoyl-tripeptide--D-alanyl-D-alanine ligase
MISGKLREYRAALGNHKVVDESSHDSEFSGISIDSRSVKRKNIFVCIAGENHDGHDYAADAVAKGASVVIADKRRVTQLSALNATVIGVDNTLATMQELAKVYLRKISPRKVAITGTNGKTTSKNLVTAVASTKYKTCSTKGNFNNQFGVPLSIFEFETDCELAVMEFGMSTPGEIKRLVGLYDPDIRVVLNIGPAHLETMKSLHDIAEAKFELLHDSKPGDWAVLNLDDPNIRSRSFRYSINKLTYGTSAQSEIHPQEVFVNGDGHTHMVYEGTDMLLPILGMHHVSNCLATLAVAKLLSIPFAKVKESIENYVPSGSRMTTEIINGVTIINDAYNSNPVSAAAAIEALISLPTTGRRVAVIGDMLELGDFSDQYHNELGIKIGKSRPELVLLIGEKAEIMLDAAMAAGQPAASIKIMSDHSEIVDQLTAYLKPNDTVLLKASRALELENVMSGLQAALGRRN